eukprot:SAG25_NODE_551_length_6985_cov_321.955998_7_plen_124_part_00
MLPRDVAGGPTSRPLGSPPRFYHIQERVKYYQCLLIRDPSGAELRRLFLEKGGDFSRKDEMSLRELVRGGHHNPAPHRPTPSRQMEMMATVDLSSALADSALAMACVALCVAVRGAQTWRCWI